MGVKEFFGKIFGFLGKGIYNEKWRCNACGKENFNGDYFCDNCLKTLPYNDKMICTHCGRAVSIPTDYCQTCKNVLTHIDCARSVFNYEKPISGLIKRAKYDGKIYLLEIFAKYLSNVYFKNFFASSVICYVPMTDKARRKRGYNQSKILAEELSKIINVPVVDAIIKKQDTERQANLNRQQRLKNLKDAFKVTDKKSIKDKSVLIVDDVSTTGATAEVLAEKLKKAGAKIVNLITIASVPPIDKY